MGIAEFIAKNLLEIVFGLLSAGALAFCRYLWKQNKDFKHLQKEEENRKYRQMIIDEIEPIIEELGRAEAEIRQIKQMGNQVVNTLEDSATEAHEIMYEDLEKIQAENDRRFALILNSYKFRLIQLCRTHLRDNYITQEDFDQLSEMHKLYTGLGGNGQAEEYYRRVAKLEIRG